MKKKTLWWIVGGCVAALVVLLIIVKNNKKTGTKVAVEKTATHTITESVTASGKIYPETEVKISPEVSGEIIELHIQEGDSVSKGNLLVRINPAIYSSMVTQAQASVSETRARVSNSREMVQQSRAQYEQALHNYERNQKLYKDKVISAMEFEQAEASYLSSKASYEASKANVSGGQYGVQGASAGLSQARENLRKTTIFAPRSGIISQLNVKLGERVVGTAQMAGTEMLTIADMSRIEVRVDVSETDIAKVKIGDTTIIEADAYRNRKFTGLVSKVGVSSNKSGAMSTDQVTNYTVHILILPESYADLAASLSRGKFVFKPGMSASVDIHTRRERNILSVPVNAVTTRDWPDSMKKEDAGSFVDLRQVVFVYNNSTKKVELRDVKTGIQDNQYIQILEGLKPGEEVVIAPYGAIARTLKDKAKVQIEAKDKLFETKSED
ncbi:MAG: HlyD family efflux transporter periplasmic adaptor subunit [Sphingobacteriales bacterium]|nr:MAG: HlyD family efflux transporter periplasmic adaptor subunit [Sphingobacteriales bacterium]